MEASSLSVRLCDVAEVSSARPLRSTATILSTASRKPPQALADQIVPALLQRKPGVSLHADPLEALARQWECQATALDNLHAALPLGSVGAQQAAALLRENTRELRAAIVQKGGR